MNSTDWSEKSVNELEHYLKDKMALPGTEHYAKAVEIWAAVDQKPVMVCICETTDDVQAAVVLAAKRKVRLAVRGGGHDWQGRSIVEGGLVIDLSKMKKINLDAREMVADIEGGVNAMELITAAAAFHMVAVVGTSGSVGMAGFTIGGGYGLISPSHGLGVDNLLSAEVVLADGSLVTASTTEHPDLLWALCGGGGNFGVVTSMRIKLHPAKTLLAGFIMFPLSETDAVLQGYRKMMDSAPDELYVLAATMITPEGIPVLLLSPIWYGDIRQGKLKIDSIRQLGHPVLEQIGEMKYADLVASFEAFIVNGRRHYVKTLWLAELTAEVAAAIKKAAHAPTSPASMVSFFHLHGAPSRVPLSATSFGLRSNHYVLNIVADWDPTDEQNSRLHRKWVDDLFGVIAPYALPGGYPNILGSENHTQIAHAHGSNLPRLQSIKRVFDPNNVFSAQPLAL